MHPSVVLSYVVASPPPIWLDDVDKVLLFIVAPSHRVCSDSQIHDKHYNRNELYHEKCYTTRRKTSYQTLVRIVWVDMWKPGFEQLN